MTDTAAAGTGDGKAGAPPGTTGTDQAPGSNSGTGNQGGNGPGSPPPAAWYDKYDTIKNDATALTIAKKYGDEKAALEAGIAAQRMIGYEKVPIPKTDADWENWYNAAGRPKSPEEYQFSKLELPEGMELDGKLDANFKTIGHKLGLNTKQADGLRSMFANYQAEIFKTTTDAAKAEQTKAQAELEREWGSAYEGHKATAIAAMKHYMTPELVAFLETSGLGNNTELVRTFHKIGKELVGENKIKLPSDGQQGETPAEIESQIIEFRQKHADALRDRQHPDNARLTEELYKLFQRRYPEQKK